MADKASATVKDGWITVTAPFQLEGKISASRKSMLHASTEQGTPDALVVEVGGKRIVVQLNAYSVRVKQESPEEKPAVKVEPTKKK